MNGYVRAFGRRIAPISPTTTVAIAPNGPNIAQSVTAITTPIRIFKTMFMMALMLLLRSESMQIAGNAYEL